MLSSQRDLGVRWNWKVHIAIMFNLMDLLKVEYNRNLLEKFSINSDCLNSSLLETLQIPLYNTLYGVLKIETFSIMAINVSWLKVCSILNESPKFTWRKTQTNNFCFGTSFSQRWPLQLRYRRRIYVLPKPVALFIHENSNESNLIFPHQMIANYLAAFYRSIWCSESQFGLTIDSNRL